MTVFLNFDSFHSILNVILHKMNSWRKPRFKKALIEKSSDAENFSPLSLWREVTKALNLYEKIFLSAFFHYYRSLYSALAFNKASDAEANLSKAGRKEFLSFCEFFQLCQKQE